MAESLDMGQVFLLDCGDDLFIWCGEKSSLMSRSKTRLLAEKINKFERKNRSKISQLRPVGNNNMYIVTLSMVIYVYTCTVYVRDWSPKNSGTFLEGGLNSLFQSVPFS